MQWEKVKPKGRCQCHASSGGEGQSPNHLFHGVTLFLLCWNCQNKARKSVTAITIWSFLGRKRHPTRWPNSLGKENNCAIADAAHDLTPQDRNRRSGSKEKRLARIPRAFEVEERHAENSDILRPTPSTVNLCRWQRSKFLASVALKPQTARP